MLKHIIFLTALLFGALVYSQKEASNWYFGDYAGIRFNANGSVTALNDGQLNTTEGCATISDANGNLLFYTDGITVWNRNHSIMPNGYGLYGDPSSTQSAIIVPKPEDPNIFYIFTVDTTVSRDDPNYGFNYSMVDLSLDSGLGAVTTKNVNLQSICSEKVTAVVKDCQTQSIWVIAFASNGTIVNGAYIYNTFYAYEVSATGLNTTPVASTFNTTIYDNRGYLKLSPNGERLACSNASYGLYLYNFDKTTGVVSNQLEIPITFSNNGANPQISYGVEFSPNNNLLYITSYFESNDEVLRNDPSAQYGALLQYNLQAANIGHSEVVLDARTTYRGGLQLGPNGKIYRAMNATYSNGMPYLSLINNPNNLGTNCNYSNNAIALGRNTRQGLPPFITSFFAEKIDIIGNNATSIELDLCHNETYTLITPNIAGASYNWSKDGIALPESGNTLFVDSEGVYEVFIDPNTGECDKMLEGIANVFYHPNPEAHNYTLTQCDEDGVLGGTTRFNLEQAIPDITGNATNVSVAFYTDSNRLNQITNPTSYSHDTSASNQIYVTVINTLTNCSANAVLTLNVSLTQVPNYTAMPVCDELNSEDGKNTFNLDAIAVEIQNENNFSFNISFYETFNDALLEQNPLNNTFENTSSPYNQTLYFRVENANSCYGISEVYLSVNLLPEIETEAIYYYCINQYPETITINAGPLSNNTAYTYQWSTGQNSYNIDINEPGVYNVTITNTQGCSKTRTITVTSSNIATINRIDVLDATINNTITTHVSGTGIYEYALYDKNNSIISPYQSSNVFENVSPGIYTVYVKDIKNNCGEISKQVAVIGFPKVFTPNNDGFNDTWQIVGVSAMFYPNTKISIYNRYGKLLKQLAPLGHGWDGLFNGQLLPSDDYWFEVKLEDGRIFKRHFSLKH